MVVTSSVDESTGSSAADDKFWSVETAGEEVEVSSSGLLEAT